MSTWTTLRNVLLALLALPFLLLWSFVAWVLTIPAWIAAVVTFGTVLGLSLGASVYDPLIAISAALLLLFLLRKYTLGQGAVVAAAIAVIVYRRTTETTSTSLLGACSFCSASCLTPSLPHADTQTVLACVLLVWTWLCAARVWIPARLETLTQIENDLYKSKLVTPYSMDIVAGLGTVHVPYCGDATDDARLPPMTLVLVHGYGAGNGFWAHSLQQMAKHFDVYAVEWNGIGRSDRPAPPKTYDEAEVFFVASLETWRHALGLDRFVLCGHSMGGIYVTNYAIQHPQHVEHLILASPAGVGLPPPPPTTFDIGRAIFSTILKLGITPMALVRFTGPLGPHLVQWIVLKRISWVPESNVLRTGEMDLDTACAYIYHNWALPRSGEAALFTHLGPGASTPRPLMELLLPGQVHWPVTFIYGGDGDWMDPAKGKDVV
ncbi:hypothetical protein As57867_006141, partial [Aphanomyces stellatus]